MATARRVGLGLMELSLYRRVLMYGWGVLKSGWGGDEKGKVVFDGGGNEIQREDKSENPGALGGAENPREGGGGVRHGVSDKEGGQNVGNGWGVWIFDEHWEKVFS